MKYSNQQSNNILGEKQSLNLLTWAVVVAQLTVWPLTMPEDLGSNPVIGNFYRTINYGYLLVEKTKIKKNRPGMAHSKNLSIGEIAFLFATGNLNDKTHVQTNLEKLSAKTNREISGRSNFARIVVWSLSNIFRVHSRIKIIIV